MVSGIIGRLRYLVYFGPMFVKYSQKWSAISFEFDIFFVIYNERLGYAGFIIGRYILL